MTATNATWVKHPGFYIKEEMEERGWLQRDLAFVLGVPEQGINMILSGKRNISADMARALADAFDTDGDFFARLQLAYDMAHARVPAPSVASLGNMQSQYPVREMIKRGWIAQADTPLMEEQLVRFFQVDAADEIPYLAHAAKKSRYEEREIPALQLAWLFRVRQIARSITVPVYSERALKTAIGELELLLRAPEEARHVPRIMAECGIRYVVVEKLPKAKIDGVCFWIDGSPVIGMSLQRDTIDNFWFVLRHEIEHVLRRDGQNEEVIDEDLAGAPRAGITILPEESAANAAAEDFCAPRDGLHSFLLRKKPYYYEKDVVAFAKLHQRHPGLIVGQMQKRMDRWDYLTRHLVKIRQFVLPSAMADGWGQTIPVSL